MMELSKRKITCQTFLSKEETISGLYRYTFNADSCQERVMRTQVLLEETGNLLDCPDFDRNRRQCRMCRRICNFRKEVANQTLKS